ncbi:MAG: pyrroline-5-carboxylate reductase [Opitutaceae bacterium]|jgi:pyrroline-5-carboxylate reductase|nr:pyrroline-5-carboxylate reductase [Opitutaceae bacterium]
MPHISFLGAGRMASAMVEGLLEKKVCSPPELACNDGGDGTAAQLAARTGVRAASSLVELVGPADTVVLACKPQQLAGLDPSLTALGRGKLVLSILAGTRLARLAEVFPSARNIVRAMPNTPGQIGAGVTVWSPLRPLDSGDRVTIESVLGALGQNLEAPEEQLDAVTGLSGSGPAYVFEFAAALRDAGEAAGLPRDTAWKLARETLLGSARLLARTGQEPEALRDQVTSPNGTTFAGLQRMKARDFRGVMKETVLAATARSEELSRGA